MYSSAFLTQSAAEAEYRAFLGEHRLRDVEFNHIEIRAGRHELAWHRNCVAIGVSYGFLEPLESTGLSLTQVAIANLAKILTSDNSAAGIEWFNQRQAGLFDTTKDFIMAHYVLTTREDTDYWRHIRHDVKLPESLADKLDHAKRRSFQPITDLANKCYYELNWNVILSGMDYSGVQKPSDNALALLAVQPHLKVLIDRIYGDDVEQPDDEEEWPDIEPDGLEGGPQHPMWYPTW